MGPRSRRLVGGTLLENKVHKPSLIHDTPSDGWLNGLYTCGYLGVRAQLKYHPKEPAALQPYLPGKPCQCQLTRLFFFARTKSGWFCVMAIGCASAVWGGVDSGEGGLCRRGHLRAEPRQCD